MRRNIKKVRVTRTETLFRVPRFDVPFVTHGGDIAVCCVGGRKNTGSSAFDNVTNALLIYLDAYICFSRNFIPCCVVEQTTLDKTLRLL